MRSMIDKFVAALLNEERETASELLRQYIIAKAQDIHESLRQGEHPVLSEDISEDIDSERYFTDDDLSDDTMTADDATDTLAGDLEAGDDAEVAADADAVVDADLEVDADVDGAEAAVDDRLDDLEAQLDDLTAEFERMMAEIEGDDVSADDEVVGAEDEVTTDVDGDSEEKQFDESLDESDFADISEAVIDELEKIKTVNTDGREAGNKSITQNQKSLPSMRGTEAHPIKSKNVTHKGFDRETAPSSDRLPKGINTQDKADQKLKSVSKDGDASAELNKPVKQNNVSPVAKLKK